jgi:formylglycine-generating enzyme required for sulfatase activity
LALVEALCPTPLPSVQGSQVDVSDWRLSWLAGEALAALSPELVSVSGQSAEVNVGTRTDASPSEQLVLRVQGWLVAILEREVLVPRERAQAGRTLDRLPGGDPRPGVSTPEALWCEVRAGPFWQGEGEAARQKELDSYWIARYPVTNAQYASYVRATGSSPPGYWQGDRPPPGLGNHPVASVTWQNAVEYCAWQTERLRNASHQLWHPDGAEGNDRVPGSWVVRLPSSDEWEKAARGGLVIPIPGENELENPYPRRTYPWGHSWHLSGNGIRGDEERCNVSESDIGTTTPVGMYPSGASPYGLVDVAGNVWEWCLDWADDEHRYRIRRGGAYRYTHEHARCSAHDRAHPGLAWPYQGFRVVLGPPVLNS